MDKKKFSIIYVGASSARKGIIYLLKAFKELNLNNSELIIIGKIENEIVPIIKKFSSDNIKFIGPKNQNDLCGYYNSSNIFVNCSIEEGLSMVQIQAMACGLPVICTTNSGGEEILEDGKSGFILPIRDVDKLKEKIMHFYENREVISIMGENAQQKAHNFFSWNNYGEKMYDFYKKILLKDN